mgnify:CR=1 FL=1
MPYQTGLYQILPGGTTLDTVPRFNTLIWPWYNFNNDLSWINV